MGFRGLAGVSGGFHGQRPWAGVEEAKRISSFYAKEIPHCLPFWRLTEMTKTVWIPLKNSQQIYTNLENDPRRLIPAKTWGIPSLMMKPSQQTTLFYFTFSVFCTLNISLLRTFPWEIQVAFCEESQLRNAAVALPSRVNPQRWWNVYRILPGPFSAAMGSLKCTLL